jgi:hypothetical protein
LTQNQTANGGGGVDESVGAEQYSTDSERLIGEQIQGTLDIIARIEASLREDEDNSPGKVIVNGGHRRQQSYNPEGKSKNL